MSEIVEQKYSLRNEPEKVFSVCAKILKEVSDKEPGAEIEARIESESGQSFTYLVEFGDEFVSTKKDFTSEMYLHTALSIVKSQLESKVHRDTWFYLHRDSGLVQTRPLTEKKERA